MATDDVPSERDYYGCKEYDLGRLRSAFDGRDSAKGIAMIENIGLIRLERYDTGEAAFVLACASGNLRVCAYLKALVPIPANTVWFSRNSAFGAAAEKGHRHVCEWLIAEFGMPAAALKSSDPYAEQMAISGFMAYLAHSITESGSAEFCEWAAATFGLGAEHYLVHPATSCPALEISVWRGRFGVCKWLVGRFGLADHDNWAVILGNALIGAIRDGKGDIRAWLEQTVFHDGAEIDGIAFVMKHVAPSHHDACLTAARVARSGGAAAIAVCERLAVESSESRLRAY